MLEAIPNIRNFDPDTPGKEVFGTLESLVRRGLGVQMPPQKVKTRFELLQLLLLDTSFQNVLT